MAKKKTQNNLIAGIDDPAVENKKGPMSGDDKAYIEQNAATMKVADIAANILRTEEAVKNYIIEKKLFSKEISVRDSEELELIQHLHKFDWWPSIKEQLSEKESEFFESYWIRLYKQFDYDVLPSEESQIRKFITLEIMKDRCQKQIRSNLFVIEEMNKKYQEELNLDKDQRDKMILIDLREQLSDLKTLAPHLNKEFIDLCKVQEEAATKLSASRNDRVKNIQDATKNWTNILKMLEDSQTRYQVGKYMEIHRYARDKEMLRLTEYHKFVDDEYDRPMLSGRLEEFYTVHDSKNKKEE